MDPMEIAAGLAEFDDRAPGSDAERRAALWLRRRLHAIGREAVLEPAWVRPQWPWAHAIHAALGVAGAVVATSQLVAGAVILALVTASATLDLLGVAHLGRRLTPERCTQNLVSAPTEATRSGARRIVRLMIVAQYDAPRGGLALRDRPRRFAATLQRLARGYLPGPLSVVAIGPGLLLAASVARLAGVDDLWPELVGVAFTVALVVALALLVELALSPRGPGAGEPASGAGVAIALAAALDRSPPRHLAVELVLAGAGDGPSLGMRSFVRRRRASYAPEATAVLHLAACGRGRPRWWTVDGPLVPLRLHPRLVAHCAQAARDRRGLGAAPRRGHGAGAAWRARLARWPAITVGCLEPDGLVPDVGRAADSAGRLDAGAMGAALSFCLEVVKRLDAELAGSRPPPRSG
ncbi:MAG: hypothetical protein ACJ76S_03865 [Solirubrobacteraceae bacterium]